MLDGYTYTLDEVKETIGQGFLLREHLHAKILLEAHTRLRPAFEKILWTKRQRSEIVLAAQLTAQCVAICQSILSLTLVGDTATAHLLLRSLEEYASNFYFVLYAGPAYSSKRGDTTPWNPAILANQFFAYQLVDQVAMMNRSMDRIAKEFSTGEAPYLMTGPQTLAAYTIHYENRKSELAKARALYKFGFGTWHEMSKFDRTVKVLEYLPNFVLPVARSTWYSLHHSYDLLNFQNHGSPILLMGVESARYGELLGSGRMMSGELGSDLQASTLCVACWYALGDLCGELHLVENMLKTVTEEYATPLLSVDLPVSVIVHRGSTYNALSRRR